MKRSRLVVPILVPGLVLALAACGSAPAPGGDSSPQVATATEIEGSLAEHAGSTVTAVAAVDQSTPLLFLDGVAIAADGHFTLALPGTVASEYLAPLDSLLGCSGLPATNVTQIASLTLEDGNGPYGAALLVPEGTATDAEPDSTYAFVYSDAEVEIDTTCTPTTTAGVRASRAPNSFVLLLHLVAGWNIVRYDSITNADGGSGMQVSTSPLLSSIFWLVYPY